MWVGVRVMWTLVCKCVRVIVRVLRGRLKGIHSQGKVRLNKIQILLCVKHLWGVHHTSRRQHYLIEIYA
jgi:hypothetical protein